MTDIAVPEHAPVTLWNVEDPELALEQASKVAEAAMRLITTRGLTKTFSGSQKPHVMVDGWLCIARLAKARTQVVTEAPLKDDNGNVIRDDKGRPHGWEAKVQVLDAHGDVVADAVSQCARDESNWRTRDDYAVRSMAQTRATGKALRVALGFVAAMAGFEATPAEEMPPAGDDGVPFVDGTTNVEPSAEAVILERTLRDIADKMSVLEATDKLIEKYRGNSDYVPWLQTQITRLETKANEQAEAEAAAAEQGTLV
jgi:hypothetical protein